MIRFFNTNNLYALITVYGVGIYRLTVQNALTSISGSMALSNADNYIGLDFSPSETYMVAGTKSTNKLYYYGLTVSSITAIS